MRILIDTNIILDILLNRPPFVQNAVAALHNFDAIITRDPRDFKNSVLRIISPKDFLRQTKNYQSL